MTVALVTGTSTGIGLATALHLGRNGYRVYASMRNLEGSKEIRTAAEKEGLDVRTVQLDVDDGQAVKERVAEVLKDAGRIDVLVNNAGIGGGTAIEEMPEEAWKAMFETNFFGALRMIQAVLPSMRQQRSGTIVNVSSVAGRLATPPQGAYSASKFALEAMSEVLAQEVAKYNVRVAIIEPGIILTPIFQKNLRPPDPNSPYADGSRRLGFLFMKLLQAPSQPDVVAEAIQHAIETDSPKLRYPVGAGADQLLGGRQRATDEEWVALGKMTDDEWFTATEKMFGIDFRPPPGS